MKKLIILIILVISIVNFNAQNIKFGTKAGVNMLEKPELDLYNSSIANIVSEVKNQSVGFHIGIFTRIELSSFFIQPEVSLLTFKTEYVAAQLATFQITQKRIDIPVQAGIKVLDVLRLQAGPIFSYNFEDDINIDQIQNFQQDDFSVGAQIGGGIDIGHFALDARYEYALTEKQTEFVQNNTQFKVNNRPNQFIVSIGYTF